MENPPSDEEQEQVITDMLMEIVKENDWKTTIKEATIKVERVDGKWNVVNDDEFIDKIFCNFISSMEEMQKELEQL